MSAARRQPWWFWPAVLAVFAAAIIVTGMVRPDPNVHRSLTAAKAAPSVGHEGKTGGMTGVQPTGG